jgi:hypothetical protein
VFSNSSGAARRSRAGNCGSAIGTCGCGGCGRAAIGGGALRWAPPSGAEGGRESARGWAQRQGAPGGRGRCATRRRIGAAEGVAGAGTGTATGGLAGALGGLGFDLADGSSSDSRSRVISDSLKGGSTLRSCWIRAARARS